MYLNDWFDVTNLIHLKAYKHLMDKGTWPKGFIPDNVERPSGWQVALMNKLSNAFIEIKLK